MNQDGCYYLWNGLGAIEDLEDAEPLINTSREAVLALKSKKEGDWTLWYRVGYRAILCGVWIPRREELKLFTVDVGELEKSS